VEESHCSPSAARHHDDDEDEDEDEDVSLKYLAGFLTLVFMTSAAQNNIRILCADNIGIQIIKN